MEENKRMPFQGEVDIKDLDKVIEQISTNTTTIPEEGPQFEQTGYCMEVDQEGNPIIHPQETQSTAATYNPWDYYNATTYAQPKQTHSCPNTTPKKKKRRNIKHGTRKHK